MKRRPILLTWPYLSMWAWMIVPAFLFASTHTLTLPERSINIHLGGWIEAMDDARDVTDAYRILTTDRTYHTCRYFRPGRDEVQMITVPAKDGHCAFLSLMPRARGTVMMRAPTDVVIDRVKESL